MMNMTTMLILPQSFTILSVAGAGIAGLCMGALIKTGVVAKQKKRMLHLEDEMLKNHARILKLEKSNAALKEDLKKAKSTNNDKAASNEMKLLAS